MKFLIAFLDQAWLQICMLISIVLSFLVGSLVLTGMSETVMILGWLGIWVSITFAIYFGGRSIISAIKSRLS